MVKTYSSMLPLGTEAPDFFLPDVTQHNQPVRRPKPKEYLATVIMFICNHCPYVKHVQAALVQLAQDYQAKQVCFIAINSNDATSYPDDSPEQMKRIAHAFSYPFPYLWDETQEVAKAYQAACTPDFFIFDDELHLIYRGQLDDARPGNQRPVTGKDIRQTLDECIQHKPLTVEQKPSMGCNIKWK